MGLAMTEQFFEVERVANCPWPRQWVTRQYLPFSTNGLPVQHWPGPPGMHANAALKEADAVTSATAKIGIEIMGFIVVSSKSARLN